MFPVWSAEAGRLRRRRGEAGIPQIPPRPRPPPGIAAMPGPGQHRGQGQQRACLDPPTHDTGTATGGGSEAEQPPRKPPRSQPPSLPCSASAPVPATLIAPGPAPLSDKFCISASFWLWKWGHGCGLGSESRAGSLGQSSELRRGAGTCRSCSLTESRGFTGWGGQHGDTDGMCTERCSHSCQNPRAQLRSAAPGGAKRDFPSPPLFSRKSEAG